jgi:hypothetical protein
METGSLAFLILGAIALFVVALVLRALLSARTPPGWREWIARRHAEGRSTRWAEWRDDD